MGFRHLVLLALAGLAGESAACADWLEQGPPRAGQLLAEASGVFVARIGKLQEQRQGDDPFAPPARVVAHFDVLEVWKGDPPVGRQLEWSLTSCDIPVLPGGNLCVLRSSGNRYRFTLPPRKGDPTSVARQPG